MAGVRLKDITDLQGARANQLYGFGLVIGLNNTGGKSLFTQQVATDMLQRLCVGSKTVQDNRSDNLFKSANISAVMVTAEIGPYCRRGSRIDVTVSILDDAQSLLNGELLLTPLRGVDGVVYAVAQGSVTVGGFSAKGQAASVLKNQVTVGRVVGGATVEHEARGEVLCNGQIRMLLKNPDHSTSSAIARVVNAWLPGRSLALDAGTVLVDVPDQFRAYVVAFLGDLGNLEVDPDTPAKVIINERTGTVVTGENVKISTVGIAHGKPLGRHPRNSPGVAARTLRAGEDHRRAPDRCRRDGGRRASPRRPADDQRRRPGARPQLAGRDASGSDLHLPGAQEGRRAPGRGWSVM